MDLGILSLGDLQANPETGLSFPRSSGSLRSSYTQPCRPSGPRPVCARRAPHTRFRGVVSDVAVQVPSTSHGCADRPARPPESAAGLGPGRRLGPPMVLGFIGGPISYARQAVDIYRGAGERAGHAEQLIEKIVDAHRILRLARFIGQAACRNPWSRSRSPASPRRSPRQSAPRPA